jgi:hypothetical protein
MFTEGIGLIMEKAAAPLFSFPFIVWPSKHRAILFNPIVPYI